MEVKTFFLQSGNGSSRLEYRAMGGTISASESHASPFFSFQDMVKNPDPRVKWAMDIMDQEGEVCSYEKERTRD